MNLLLLISGGSSFIGFYPDRQLQLKGNVATVKYSAFDQPDRLMGEAIKSMHR
jgi:hypothetical protein